MRIAPAALGLASLLAGCQWLPWTSEAPQPKPVRVQGELARAGEMLMLSPCGEERHLLLLDAGQLGLEGALRTCRATRRGRCSPISAASWTPTRAATACSRWSACTGCRPKGRGAARRTSSG